MIRVLFVCLGNICRSPMAEALFQHKVKLAGLADQIESDSAGTGDWHVGKPPHLGTAQVLTENGVDYIHQARQIARADLNSFDYVITMDDANRDAVERLGTGRAKVVSLMSFALQTGVAEVPDPYYDGNFEGVYHLVDSACDGLIDAIRKEHDL